METGEGRAEHGDGSFGMDRGARGLTLLGASGWPLAQAQDALKG